MIFKETIAVDCENRVKHVNTLCGHNAEFHLVFHKKYITSPIQKLTG
jgi:hypothetical protein